MVLKTWKNTPWILKATCSQLCHVLAQNYCCDKGRSLKVKQRIKQVIVVTAVIWKPHMSFYQKKKHSVKSIQFMNDEMFFIMR